MLRHSGRDVNPEPGSPLVPRRGPGAPTRLGASNVHPAKPRLALFDVVACLRHLPGNVAKVA